MGPVDAGGGGGEGARSGRPSAPMRRLAVFAFRLAARLYPDEPRRHSAATHGGGRRRRRAGPNGASARPCVAASLVNSTLRRRPPQRWATAPHTTPITTHLKQSSRQSKGEEAQGAGVGH